VAFIPNRIDEIEQRLNRIDGRRESLELQIEGKNKIGADPFFDVRILRDLNREAEALSAELNALKNQQGDQNSAKGQTAESQVENTEAPAFKGEGVQAFTSEPEPLTDEEENKAAGAVFNPDGEAVAFGQERPAVVSNEDDGFDGRLVGEGELQLGSQSDKTSDANTKQNELSQQAAVSQDDLKRTNVLHDYASSTYRISLYLLTRDDYNDLTENPGSFVPKNLLVQSGGGELNNRHPDFKVNFGIDNFKMFTVVGLNASSRASNTLTFDFDIIEPYGMTFLDRLISANITTGDGNYLAQPYMLQIDFLGNASDPDGNNFIIDTKRIPIKFLNMKIAPGEGNTEYKINAIAYNHSPFQQTTASIPKMLTVRAGTVGEFFGNSEEGDTTSSFPASINEWYRSTSGPDTNFKFPRLTVKFNVDPLFADSKIVNPLTAELKTVPMAASVIPGLQAQASFGDGKIPKARTEQTFPIQQGTNINSVIDMVMQKSNYITDQVKEFNGRAGADESLDEFKFLNWYKIIPEVKLNEYDNGDAQDYAMEVTYNIVPYITANTNHPDFAKTKIAKDNVVRTYNYRYTGKNTDIIDLDITFDTAFYTAKTQFFKNRAGSSLSKRNETDIKSKENKFPYISTDKSPRDLPSSLIPVGANAPGSGQVNRTDDFKSITVTDIASSIYSRSAGDMLSIQMKIIGDPAFIKQDDMYYNPSRGGYDEFKQGITPELPINNSGQIVFDTNQVYVQLLVKSATDIDDNVGIMNPNTADTLSSGYKLDSTFSGVFKVLTVESTLSQGQFEQTIHIIKMPNTLTDFSPESDADNSLPEVQEINNVLGIQDDLNFVSAPEPEVQQVNNVFGIAGNDITALVEARNSPDPGVFPIVNGEGVPESAQQQTQSSKANINNTTVEIQQNPPFSNPAGIA